MLREQVVDVDRLRRENEQLQADIARLRQSQPERPAPSNSRVVLGALSPNSHNITEPKIQSEDYYVDLIKKFKKLKALYDAKCQANDECRTVLRARKQTIEEWAHYADRQDKKIQQLRDTLKARRAATTQSGEKDKAESIQDETSDAISVRRPDSVSGPAHFAPPASSLFTSPTHSITPISPRRVRSEPPLQNKPLTVIEAVIDELISAPDVSNEETELPPHLAPQVGNVPFIIKQEEPSSDRPVFISARAVRKRKHETAEAEPERLQKIKSEHSNSSNSEVAGEHHHSAAESIDYEKETHVPTPRKRKRKALSRAMPEGRDGDEEVTPLRERLDMQMSVAYDTSTPNVISSSSKSDVSTHYITYQASDVQHNGLELLLPPQSPSLRSSSKRWSHHPHRLNVGVMDLAEDGETGSENVWHPAVKGRLDLLLDPPSHGAPPSRDSGLAKQGSTPGQGLNSNDGRLKLAPRRQLPFKRSTGGDAITKTPIVRSKANTVSPQPSVIRQKGPKKPSILREDMPRGRTASKESTPLRDRPTDRLRPEDFKPNSRYNDGLTYVFEEVVRGKEARAALSGCIDHNCCGKTFRHFAKEERKTIGSSVTSRIEDIKLLETYLGDEAWRLGTMLPDEKEETWLLAKTRELANKFGKHRQRYSRMPTPPGFWSVDFPSTQERAEERRQADEIRAALTRERYREAMRSNGAWLFRDEEPH